MSKLAYTSAQVASVDHRIFGQRESQRLGVPITESPIFWEILLQLIEEGKVIPVVGRDLLTVSDADGARLLYPYLAQKLAAKLGVPADNLPDGDELNEVACRYITAGKLVEDIYPELKVVVSAAETALQVPEPLLRLAEIPQLRFFVTTTFDSFLSRALNQVRFAGNEDTRVFAYAPSNPNDLPSDFKGPQNLADVAPPVVYHLMGRLSATPVYAVTQEDVVEYFHSLQSETHRPQLLFDELNSKSLLILGCRFGGWLTRFLMRMSKGQRLSAGGRHDFVADVGVSSDADLVLFLHNFSRATKIYQEGGVLDFVNKLHQRWMELHPVQRSGQVKAVTAPAVLTPTDVGPVFLSYASEDRGSAEKIKDALEAVGINVFFDRDNLQSGDDWELVLRNSISQCSLFLPIISRRTSAPGHRVFREEWHLAVEEEERVPYSAQFLLPVVIDDIPVTEADVPPRFRSIQWQTLPSGQPTPEFVSHVRQIYRRNQLKSRAPVA